MSSLRIGLKPTTSDAALIRSFNDAISNHFKTVLTKSIPLVTSSVQNIVKHAITSSPEYQSLLNGELREEFGIEDSQDELNAIVSYVTNNINVRYLSSGFGQYGGFEISILGDDLSGLYNIVGTYVSRSSKGVTTEIPWLEWLLTRGNNIIITNYSIDKSEPHPRSRTGKAIMVKGGSWQVPDEFSGVEGDNWLTRTIESVHAEIEFVIREIISSGF